MSEAVAFVYAVRNREGKWFHRVGYGGYGETWVENFAKATIYRKLGQARGRVTFFAAKWPQYGVPVVVEFALSPVAVHDEAARVKASIERKAKKSDDYERRRAAWERAEPRRPRR